VEIFFNHSHFVFWRCRVKISAHRLAILTAEFPFRKISRHHRNATTSFYIISSSYSLIHPSFAAKQNKLTLSSVKNQRNKNSIPGTMIRAKVTLKGTTVEKPNPFKHQRYNIILHNFNGLNEI
jgi:hypothetical protein